MKTPLLRPVSFQESGRISPWPSRILGLDPWRKPQRTSADVLAEYETGYGKLVDAWAIYASSRDALSEADALRFMRTQTRSQCRSLVASPIYGSTADDYLVSSGEHLFSMNLELAIDVAKSLLIGYLHDLQCELGFRNVIETGCGSGLNLMLLYSYLDLVECRGGDICPSAVKFIQQIFRDCRMRGKFEPFDYNQPDDLGSLTSGLDDYILFTSHSIEQIQLRECGFIESLLSLPNPPRRVVHFEPIIDPSDETPTACLRRKYAEINHYNSDLLQYIRNLETEGKLTVVDYIPCLFGASAFNPTSILQWQPKG